MPRESGKLGDSKHKYRMTKTNLCDAGLVSVSVFTTPAKPIRVKSDACNALPSPKQQPNMPRNHAAPSTSWCHLAGSHTEFLKLFILVAQASAAEPSCT
jgi:hypothetical protein